ncbi:MAG: amidohydrolase [Deltaproteobacteria bacterium]|nr:amidohydrolase [Deltaproteobacteria bacterium]
MKRDDAILLSIDDHLIEPPDLFERHMPASLRDQAPRLVNDIESSGPLVDVGVKGYGVGVDRWVFQGQSIGLPGLGAVCSWPKEEWNLDPCNLSEMRPGLYDLEARVRDMDANGVLAGLNFPTFPGFAGAHLARMPDRTLTNATISAYNDYMLDEWVASHPGRFIPMAIVPFYDIEASVAEINRVAVKGCRAVTLPETPYGLDLPDFSTGHWDPIFAALCNHDMVACLHIGGGFGLVKRPPTALVDDLILLAPHVMAITCTDIMLSGLFQRFPSLRIALSEGGIGWIPFLLDRLDRHMTNQAWTHLDKLPKGKTPTEVFRDHFLACFITDPSALRLRDRIGVESIAWECDYPHSDCTWPESPEMLFGELTRAGCTDDEIDLITWKNVARFFDWDPFKHTPREEATVGALRARATDVDTSATSRHEYRKRFEERAARAGT